MKKHSEIGVPYSSCQSGIIKIANAILYHHEHWDGNGYPHGLKGKKFL